VITEDQTGVVEFLAATTMRLCVDRHRRDARDEKAGARLRGWYADEPSPEDVVCDRAEAAWVAGLAEALPDSQRSALAAKADGLSGMEVAARHGVSYKAVESLLSRARTQLRAAVATTLSAVAAATAAAHRRGPTQAEAVAGVSLAAFVTMSVLLGTAPPRSTEEQRREVLTPTLAAPLAAGPVMPAGPALASPAAGGAVALPALTPPPVPPGGGGYRLPLPTYSSPPQPLCGRPVPNVDPCLPLDDPTASYTPGEHLMECMRYGIDLSHGFECSAPPSPDRPKE